MIKKRKNNTIIFSSSRKSFIIETGFPWIIKDVNNYNRICSISHPWYVYKGFARKTMSIS